jgi:hypothetical protein
MKGNALHPFVLSEVEGRWHGTGAIRPSTARLQRYAQDELEVCP